MIVGSGIWRMTYLTVFDWAWINAIILNTCRYIFRVNVQERIFLALLDYVRRAHEIEIRPSSVCFFDLSLTFLYGFLSNFSCGFPRRFLNFWKKKFFFWFVYTYFSFLLTWDPMGAKMSKLYSYKSQPKVLKLYFPPNRRHKTMFGSSVILSFWFLTFFF